MCNEMYYLFVLRGENMIEKYDDKWINIDEAAEYLGIKTVTLRGWIKKDRTLPAQKVGKQWKFKRSEIDEWVKSGNSTMK
jgi:excisionase family DNA binding protein